MNTIPADDPPPGHLRERLQAERTRHVYALARYGQPLGVVAAAVLAGAIGYSDGHRRWLAAWVMAKIAVLAREAVLDRAYRASDRPQDPRWERSLAIACAMLGSLWALLPLFMMPALPSLQIITVIAIVGVTTATIGALGVSALAFHAYVLPTIAGLVLACVLRGGFENLTLGGLIVVYMVFLACVQRAIAFRFIDSVMARVHNEELVAQLRRTDAALKESLAEHELLFDLASVGIAEFRQRRIVRTNARLEQMLGYEADALLGASEEILQPADADPESMTSIADTLARGLTVERDVQVRRRDGGALWVGLACRAIDPSHPLRGVIAVFNDITDRREREAAIHRLAHEDALTGLPNRRLLTDRLHHALLRSRRQHSCVALLLIDLDGFKKVNDNHGHEVGDQVLIAVARRLLACVRASDTVSRLGGDEFVVLLDQPIRPSDATQIAEKLVSAVCQPIAVAALTVHVGACIGISVAPQDGTDGETLLRCADDAMYRAKRAGRGTWRLHREEHLPATAAQAAGPQPASH